MSFLHDQILLDPPREAVVETGTPLPLFREIVRPALERLVADGRAGAWGISARGVVPAVLEALADNPPPAVAQVVTNALALERALVDAAATRCRCQA